MKKLLWILVLMCVWINSYSTHYYVSASGSDANSGLIGSPWRTITKVNTVTFAPGDIISFNGGDVFSGKLVVRNSGSAGNVITYNSYGSGQAIFSGFATATGFTSVGTNLWESAVIPNGLSVCNMVTIGGTNFPMGRTPNVGYYTYQSFVAHSSITSTNLNAAAINYTGATAVIRVNDFTTLNNLITSQSGTTLNYTSANPAETLVNGYGFFIQNDVRTLDVQNEWYYNPSTKKIRIYSTSSPVNVQVSTGDTLFYNLVKNYITVDNISFVGSNKYALAIHSSNNVTIQNCNIDFSGQDAIWGAVNFGLPSSNFRLLNNTINHTNNNVFTGANDFAGALISGNTIRNSGVQVGMGGTGAGNYSNYCGLQTSLAANVIFEYNTIINTGYNPLVFSGANGCIARFNYIDSFCTVKMDGGGIYTIGPSTITGTKILSNIVRNGIGCNPGTTNVTAPVVHGIYLDEAASNIEVGDNTAENCAYSGLYIHNGNLNVNAHDNTFYNNGLYGTLVVSFGGVPISGLTFLNNINFSKTATQRTIAWESSGNNLASFGNSTTVDSNYYARPIDDNLTLLGVINGNFGSPILWTLAMWKSYSGVDIHSQKSPRAITNVNQLFFCYNPTNSDSTISLPGNYVDVRNVAYPGTITLSAFTSAVLISTGTNLPPVANAGADKNITLPTNSITQVGSGTDADGTIVSYQWLQVFGPGPTTIVSPTSATTVINLPTNGTYGFQLTVRDNSGAIGTDQMTVIVNAAPPANIPPTANAGGNKVITLPTATVTQVGSGTDSDGTIVSYAWTKTSGPATYTIVSPTSATTVINNLVAGTYVFTLTVTDNLGATGSSTAQVIVNIAPNQAPTASAGIDQTLTWPTNTTTVSAAGSSDPDGTIVAYTWSKLSGPASYGIINAGSSTATINGLDIGAYQFQVQVTDNSGATATDVIGITQNRGSATITQSGLSKVYNTFPQGITVTTSPAGITTSTTYNGISTQPSLVGSYTVVTGGNDPHWTMTTVTNTFTITKATAVINASSATVNFDNLPHSIAGTTTPSVTGLSATYTGISGTVYPTSATPPTAIGTYRVDFTVTNSNYQATPISVNLTIVSNPAIIFISDTLKTYTGVSQNVTVTSPYSYSLVYSPATHVNAGTYQVIATINDGIHTGADTATLTVSKASGTLSWPQPSPIPFGAQLTALQLNATSTVPGAFTYNHVLGEVLPIGVTTITATFTPSDPANFNSGSITRAINVYAVNPFLNFFITGVDGRIFFIEQ